jgi:hypothetical protein
MAYRQVKRLTAAEAAYVAGLIDGEGTISLTRKHRHDNLQLSVSISSTERPLLQYVLKTVGAGRITNKRSYQSHHTPSVTYTISNRQALALLEQIHVFLHTYKARRAQLVLRDYIRLTPRNGKYTPALARARTVFIEKFLRTTPRQSAGPARKIRRI